MRWLLLLLVMVVAEGATLAIIRVTEGLLLLPEKETKNNCEGRTKCVFPLANKWGRIAFFQTWKKILALRFKGGKWRELAGTAAGNNSSSRQIASFPTSNRSPQSNSFRVFHLFNFIFRVNWGEAWRGGGEVDFVIVVVVDVATPSEMKKGSLFHVWTEV